MRDSNQEASHRVVDWAQCSTGGSTGQEAHRVPPDVSTRAGAESTGRADAGHGMQGPNHGQGRGGPGLLFY